MNNIDKNPPIDFRKLNQKLSSGSSDDILRVEIEAYKKLLTIFQVGSYYCYVFNVKNTQFIFAYATFKKSVPMLTITYIFFLIMFVGDFFIGISQKENPLIISALVMCIISSTMISFLNKQSK